MGAMDGSFISLTREEQEDLLHAIETSVQVKKRHQFFLWTQGPLCAFIPHSILICVVNSSGKDPFVLDRFNSIIISDDVFEEICHPDTGLVKRAMGVWRESDDSPVLISPEVRGPTNLYERFSDILERTGLGGLAAHGSSTVQGSGIASTFFVFAGMPIGLTLRHAYFLDLLLPHIHMAFMRTIGSNDRVSFASGGESRPPLADKMMTEREVEILGWVQEGKSNYEIGMILEISPLTVKNHVQKILKKLNVRNRAQAVSKATSMQIIGKAAP